MRLLSELRKAPRAKAVRGTRAMTRYWRALPAVIFACAMIGQAVAQVPHVDPGNTRLPGPRVDPDNPGGASARPRIDPDLQGGAPLGPVGPAAPLPQPAYPSPPPFPQYRVTGVVWNDVLNIRTGPDARSAVVGTIPPSGNGIRMTGNCAGNWCPIDYRGTQGWVNRNFLSSE